MSYKANKYVTEYKQIILELKAQNFDYIKYATYRTACKLRFIQKKLNLHLIDIFNVIETFRDNSLHTLDILTTELDTAKLEKIISSMYTKLNMRLSLSQQVNIDNMTTLLTSWLINIYDKVNFTRISLFSFKIALTTLCSGKLIDKFKYVYTQISDSQTAHLVKDKFELYLKEILKIPANVFEEPSFPYTDQTSSSCFDFAAPISLEIFLDTLMSYPGSSSFLWLHVLNRIILTQNVIHHVKCAICLRTNFMGFRYKCLTCRNYQMCQDCFWRGRISASHLPAHGVKEYTHYKSTAKQLSSSLKRSFFCKPSKSHATLNNGLNSNHLLNYDVQLEYPVTPTINLKHEVTGTSMNKKQQKKILEQQQFYSQHQIMQPINQLNGNGGDGLNKTGSLKLSPCCAHKAKAYSKDPKVLFNKPIDLTHIVPSPTTNQQVPQQQPQQAQQHTASNEDLYEASQQQQTLKNQTVANTTTTTTTTNDLTEDEHRFISRCTTRLGSYYSTQQQQQLQQSQHYRSYNNQTLPSSLSSCDTNVNNAAANRVLTFNNEKIKATVYNEILSQNNATRSISDCNFKKSSSVLSTNENIIEKKRHLVKLEQQNRELSTELRRLIAQQNELTNSQRIYNSQDLNDYAYMNTTRYSSLSRESTPFTLMNTSTSTNTNNLQTSKSILAAVNLLNNNSNTMGSAATTTATTTSQLLQLQQQQQQQSGTIQDPYLLAELKSLKKYTNNLDNRMNHLEHNRFELLNQLTQLKRTASQSTRSTPQRGIRDQTPSKYATITNYMQQHGSQQHKYAQSLSYSATSSSSQHNHPSSIMSSSHHFTLPMNSVHTTPISPVSTLNYPNYNQQQQPPLSKHYANTSHTRSSSMPSTPSMPKLHHHAAPSQQSQQQFSKHASPNRRLYPTNLTYASTNGSNCSEMTTTTGSTSSITNKALREDLLIAADYLTNAMQDLVKNLDPEIDNSLELVNQRDSNHMSGGSELDNLLQKQQMSTGVVDTSSPPTTTPSQSQSQSQSTGYPPYTNDDIDEEIEKNAELKPQASTDANGSNNSSDDSDNVNEEQEQNEGEDEDGIDDDDLYTRQFIRTPRTAAQTQASAATAQKPITYTNTTNTVTTPNKTKPLTPLDIDEDAFMFEGTALMVNDTNADDDVVSWRKELEKRLDNNLPPPRPRTPTPPSSVINEELSNKSS